MKKIITLMMFLAVTMTSWAAKGDIYEIIFNGKNVVRLNGEELTADAAASFFTYNTAKHNFNSKFKGCDYAGVTFTQGLKMEGATLVQWTATADAKVTILQSDWGDPLKTLIFDEDTLNQTTAEHIQGGILYAAIENVPAGTHTIKRGNGESGLFYIRIDYTSNEKERLATPEISVDKTTGSVSVSSVQNAKEIRYTLNGKNPTANDSLYNGPFKVEDGTTVNVIAIGEGDYVNSAVATELVLVDGITVAEPVINQINGTFYAKSATINSTVEYSFDQQNWLDGSRAITLTETKTVYARASRENCTTSPVVSAEVNVVAAPTNTEKVYFFYDNPETYTIWAACNENQMDGNGDYTDYSLAITGNTSKYWSNGEKLIIPGIALNGITFNGDSVTSLKVSNGAQNTITLPAGKKAVRLTFYSYVNAEKAAASPTGWIEVNGVNYDYATVPMTAFTDQFRTEEIADSIDANTGQPATKQVKDIASHYDIRVFDLDNVEENITFANKGTQVAFVALLELATDQTETDPSAIRDLKTVGLKAETFNLAGQKVAAGFRGMAIKNGKKVVLK
jgi:hypothetical protein